MIEIIEVEEIELWEDNVESCCFSFSYVKGRKFQKFMLNLKPEYECEFGDLDGRKKLTSRVKKGSISIFKLLNLQLQDLLFK